MDEIKEFKKVDLAIMQKLVGLKLKNIFKQLDMFIFSFGDEVEYALHVFSFLRIRKDNEIIMTSTDEYLFPDHTQIPKKTYKKDEMHEKSLLMLTLQKTKEMIKLAKVNKVDISDVADLFISFDNGVVVEIFTDCLWQDNEFYRFFKYRAFTEPHYIVEYSENKILLEILYGDTEMRKKAAEMPDSKKLKKLKAKLDKNKKLDNRNI